MRQQLGERIRYLRKQKGMTIAETAYNSNCEYSFYCKIEKGKVNVSVNKLSAIADALGISLLSLFDFRESMTKVDYIKEIVSILELMTDSDLESLLLNLKEYKKLFIKK